MDKRWKAALSSLGFLTSLSESLDWEHELSESLFKQWNQNSDSLAKYDKPVAISLMVGYLPEDKKYLKFKLLNWLKENYNPE